MSEEDVITGFRCNQQFELIKFPTKCQDVIIDRGYMKDKSDDKVKSGFEFRSNH